MERYQWCLKLKTLEIKTHLGHYYLHTVILALEKKLQRQKYTETAIEKTRVSDTNGT